MSSCTWVAELGWPKEVETLDVYRIIREITEEKFTERSREDFLICERIQNPVRIYEKN